MHFASPLGSLFHLAWDNIYYHKLRWFKKIETSTQKQSFKFTFDSKALKRGFWKFKTHKICVNNGI